MRPFHVFLAISTITTGYAIEWSGGNFSSSLAGAAAVAAGLFGIDITIQKAAKEITKKLVPHSPSSSPSRTRNTRPTSKNMPSSKTKKYFHNPWLPLP